MFNQEKQLQKTFNIHQISLKSINVKKQIKFKFQIQIQIKINQMSLTHMTPPTIDVLVWKTYY